MTKLFVATAGLAIGVTLVYLGVDVKHKRLAEEINKYEQEYAIEEKNYILEYARWEIKLTTENLSRTLRDHGLAMEVPTASQIVRIDSDGRMFPGQSSEARANRVLVPRASATDQPRLRETGW
ncbi:MAG: hypothetical protein FWH21_06400 [Kiritimatiellaeota bacterium]|nr:hypothetical protein [Kiritimatiellota bacterium]